MSAAGLDENTPIYACPGMSNDVEGADGGYRYYYARSASSTGFGPLESFAPILGPLRVAATLTVELGEEEKQLVRRWLKPFGHIAQRHIGIC